ncbi:hypothetical protein [Streptomyces qinglanensis]|uniref:Uncharacterized protein n=1 Tax=Streptomyces qinglanensis TaxID=943816 RepID=A0A1H9WDB1_9ACTN|nr:hypothetical protein [Streptomyces qinglanensis]SES31835.1 hypothetical protein SAMN05421870_1173 [Streptomyces qinglanensis]
MPQRDDDEPVFKKSNWGTSRYVYNPDNPVGLALTILSVVLALVTIFMMNERKGPFAVPEEPSWSPSIDDDPVYPWEKGDETTPSETPEPSVDAKPSGSAAQPPGRTVPSGMSGGS